MRRSRQTVLGLALLLIVFGGVPGRAQSPDGRRDDQRFAAGTSAVMVDVVVRDRRGEPITDLTLADFEILEDGVAQEIGALSLVAPERARGVARGRPPAEAPGADQSASSPPNTIEAPTFVALAFDRLTPEARGLAHRGAQAYLETSAPDDFAGVFLLDQSLATVQTYTNDREKVRAAIDEAASRATSLFTRDSERVRPSVYGDMDAMTPPTASADSPGQAFDGFAGNTDPHRLNPTVGPKAAGEPSIGDLIFQMMNRMERRYAEMVRDQQGYATTAALSALIDSLSLLPGRKTVVFFAESIAIPANVQARFDAVVAHANRANVSIYAIDAAGLRVHSGQAARSREIGSVAADSAELNILPDGGGGARLSHLERHEDALRRDPDVGLRMLAERTGGLFLNNTNDLQRAFRAIDADRRFHYLLTYAPRNTEFTGGWRSVAVRVKRAGVTVRHRTGYVASPALGAVPLLAYEGPVLAALEARPLPRALPVRAMALPMLTRAGEPRTAVLVATDASALAFQANTASDAWVTDFAVLARIKDDTGAVVRKGSVPYRLSGPLEHREQAQQGEVLFYRQPQLPPGEYLLQAAVHDALAGTSGVRFVPFTVPPPGTSGLQVSSLLLVRRAERIGTDDQLDETNPLVTGELLLYPNLGEPFGRGTDQAVPFFLRIKPAAGGSPVTATLEVRRTTGQTLAELPIALPTPSARGVIDHSAQVPLDALDPGDYTLRMLVRQNGDEAIREASLRVVP